MSAESSMTYSKLSEKAFEGAVEYLTKAIRHVDALEGWGGAKQNPALVAALVQASAIEYLALMVSHRVVPEMDNLTARAGELIDIALDIRDK